MENTQELIFCWETCMRWLEFQEKHNISIFPGGGAPSFGATALKALGWVRLNPFLNSLSTQLCMFINFSSWFILKLMISMSLCHRRSWTCSRGQQGGGWHIQGHQTLPPDLPQQSLVRLVPDCECQEWKLWLQECPGFLWDGGSSPDPSSLLRC